MRPIRTIAVACALIGVFVLAVRLFADEEGRRLAGFLLTAGAVAVVLTDRELRR